MCFIPKAGNINKLPLLGQAYSWRDTGREVLGNANLGPSFNLDIEPDDIVVSDTVTVVWEIV